MTLETTTLSQSTTSRVLDLLSEGNPKSSAEIATITCLKPNVIWAALRRCWQKGLILRSAERLRETHYAFKGRAGVVRNLRTYYLYTLKPKDINSLILGNNKFTAYQPSCQDRKAACKANAILSFLKTNSHNAYFTTELANLLSTSGIRQSDVMSNVRRWERRGLVYVRGYRLDDRQTPFKQGYLVTWINHSTPRDEAIKEAIEKTEVALLNSESTNPTIQRVHRIRDVILASSRLRELVSITYLCESLGCSKYEAEVALTRALQLYSDLREVRLFDAFRYFYHDSMNEDEFKAAKTMKENYIRVIKGKANRIGHNWEAVTEWFIDKFTTGAHFWTQNHRIHGMDPRRITIHLFRNVGGRKRNAEVDRVWDVNPGVFSPSITYVLSCKWGVIFKRDIDDFFDVLRWSKEFGVNTPNGREIKQSIIGVFAGSAFNPREKIRLKDDSLISLASYAARMNIQLLKASDFNNRLYERGCPLSISAQKVCKTAKDEKQVREILEEIWKMPKNTEQILLRTTENNKETYELEKTLESQND